MVLGSESDFLCEPLNIKVVGTHGASGSEPLIN